MPLLAESHNLFGEICMESHNFDNMLAEIRRYMSIGDKHLLSFPFLFNSPAPIKFRLIGHFAGCDMC